MSSLSGVVGAFGFLGIVKEVLAILFFISVIILSFKSVQALNIYINKNTK